VQESCKIVAKVNCFPEFLRPIILLGALPIPIILPLISNFEMSQFEQCSTESGPDFRPDEIHVKIDAIERTVSLTFQLVGEFHTMNRGYDETVEKTLHRFSITCRSKLSKTSNKAARNAKKQAKGAGGNDPDASSAVVAKPEPPLLLLDNLVCDGAAIQNFDLQTGMTVVLDGRTYTVVVNPPTVTSLSAYPKHILYAGCPLVPQVTIEYGDEFSCMWAVETIEGVVTIVSRDKVFVPTPQHVGCHVKLYCSARCSQSGRTGRAVVFYLPGEIQAGFASVGDFNRMISVRADFCVMKRASPRAEEPVLFPMLQPSGARGSTSNGADCSVSEPVNQDLRGNDELRVMTYNILAEPFATSDQAYTTLYPYCDPSVLQSEYRIQRILAELVACDADVICLQECDLRTFECYLLPLLGKLGYEGHFTCKGSTEGCATFTYSGTCTVVARVDLPLKNVLREAPYLDPLYQQRPDLRDVLGGKLGTVAQLTIVQCVHRPDRALIVANTHLFYHPLASFLRTIQAYAVTLALSALKRSIESAQPTEWHRQDFVALVQGEETNHAMLDKEHRLARTLLQGGWVEGHSNCPHRIIATEGCEGTVKASAVFCGDLNSSPNIAAMQFLTK
jgi:hypothetical protein